MRAIAQVPTQAIFLHIPPLHSTMFGGFGGRMGGGGGMGVTVFNEKYNCYPVSFMGRDELEDGGKIVLPPSALETLSQCRIQVRLLVECWMVHPMV